MGRSIIEVDGLRLDPVNHRVSANGETIRAGPTEFRMHRFFFPIRRVLRSQTPVEPEREAIG